MAINLHRYEESSTCAAGKLQYHPNKQKQEKLEVLRRSKMEAPVSHKGREMQHGHDHGRHRNHCRCGISSAALNLFIISAWIQTPVRGVHAYSVATSFGPHSSGQQRGRSSSLISQRTSLTNDHRLSNNVNAQKSQLFSSASDISLGPADETMAPNVSLNKEDADEKVQRTNSQVDDETVFDNLLPSTMSYGPTSTSAYGPTSRAYGPSATGPSSSVLLPMSDQPSPLFQSTNNPSGYNNVAAVPPKATSWKERLMDVSNLASFLCVLDCTLLPLVSVAIPALSWGVGALGGATSSAAASSNPMMAGLSSFMAVLPAISHGIALYFVIPVGLLTTLVNYLFGHKEIKFSLLSCIGVALIYVANSSVGVGIPSIDAWLHATGIAVGVGHTHGHGAHVHDTCGAVVGAATGMMAHTCPEGVAHRLTNTLGCAFLLGSNYYAKKYMEEKSQGCAASALAEAWGGDGAGRAVCPPGCGCQKPSYGTNGPGARAGGEAFFEWENKSTGRGPSTRGMSGSGGRSFGTRFRR